MTVECTCRASTSLHNVDCATVAATQPHAMINDGGEVFYPDNPDDAHQFWADHGARPVNPLDWPWPVTPQGWPWTP